jgi:hypothetical protein
MHRIDRRSLFYVPIHLPVSPSFTNPGLHWQTCSFKVCLHIPFSQTHDSSSHSATSVNNAMRRCVIMSTYKLHFQTARAFKASYITCSNRLVFVCFFIKLILACYFIWSFNEECHSRINVIQWKGYTQTCYVQVRLKVFNGI